MTSVSHSWSYKRRGGPRRALVNCPTVGRTKLVYLKIKAGRGFFVFLARRGVACLIGSYFNLIDSRLVLFFVLSQFVERRKIIFKKEFFA